MEPTSLTAVICQVIGKKQIGPLFQKSLQCLRFSSMQSEVVSNLFEVGGR